MLKSWHWRVPSINLKLIPFSPTCPVSILIFDLAICNGSVGRRENWPAGPDPLRNAENARKGKTGKLITGRIRGLELAFVGAHGESIQDLKSFAGGSFDPVCDIARRVPELFQRRPTITGRLHRDSQWEGCQGLFWPIGALEMIHSRLSYMKLPTSSDAERGDW